MYFVFCDKYRDTRARPKYFDICVQERPRRAQVLRHLWKNNKKRNKKITKTQEGASGPQPAGSRHDAPGCVKHKKERIPRARLSAKHKKEAA